MIRLITALLVLIGIVLIAVGIVYFAVKAGSLPSFFPGHVAGSSAHRSKHGVAAVVVGAVVLVLAVMMPAIAGGSRRHR